MGLTPLNNNELMFVSRCVVECRQKKTEEANAPIQLIYWRLKQVQVNEYGQEHSQTQGNIYNGRPWLKEHRQTKYMNESNIMRWNTGETDDEDDQQVDDCGSEFRWGDKRILGSVVKKTQTELCRWRLWHIYCVCVYFFLSFFLFAHLRSRSLCHESDDLVSVSGNAPITTSWWPIVILFVIFLQIFATCRSRKLLLACQISIWI